MNKLLFKKKDDRRLEVLNIKKIPDWTTWRTDWKKKEVISL